ncbi:MAG: VWA domain-containing protein [Bacteroidales bacterium]|nr:VWA domain-containing protein [Bacteroidales bacterium]
MKGISFAYPWFLVLLALIPLLVAWYLWRRNRNNPSLTVSSAMQIGNMTVSFRHILRHVLFAVRLLVITILIIILARPQSTDKWQDVTTEGIDIMLAVDISGSMLARDFKPDRIEAAKNVATEFISGRPYDRMGLVVFSGESFTQCPLTTDQATLINLLREIKSGIIEDGTAIGMGIATAVNRLKDSDAKSKVVILLTDGVNNRGAIDPLTAADLASTFNIRVYTIGVGSMGTAPYPVQTPFGMQMQNVPVEIDEDILQEISSRTGGRYFRATDNDKLLQVYQEIDKLEKSMIDVKEYNRKSEEYMPLSLVALALLLAEMLARYLLMKNL